MSALRLPQYYSLYLRVFNKEQFVFAGNFLAATSVINGVALSGLKLPLFVKFLVIDDIEMSSSYKEDSN